VVFLHRKWVFLGVFTYKTVFLHIKTVFLHIKTVFLGDFR
jgi:hypothetical protein